MKPRRWGWALAVSVIGLGACAVFACGGGEKATAGVAGPKLPDGVRSESIEHEACQEAGHRVEVLDANNDGKADVKRVYDLKTGKETCRITDLNHDGSPDMFEYYDANGQLRRREADYDDNGVVNAIEYYEMGKLARRELDTTNQGRIDTWDTFDTVTGKRIKRERDSTNDGRVDQWWTWEGDKVTIAMDRNGDGLPDPEATVVIGGTADAGAPLAASPAAATDGGPAAPAPPAPPEPPAASAAASAAPDAGTDAGKPRKSGGAKR